MNSVKEARKLTSILSYPYWRFRILNGEYIMTKMSSVRKIVLAGGVSWFEGCW